MTPNVQYQWPQKKYLRLTTTFYTTQKDQKEFKALLNRINLSLSHKTHLFVLCKTLSNRSLREMPQFPSLLSEMCYQLTGRKHFGIMLSGLKKSVEV